MKNQNLTRWSSAFLMMLSFLRANSRGCFDENNPLPVSLKDLEIYTQILLSLHEFSLIVQRSNCCNGHVLPLIWNIVHGNFERFRLNDEPKELRDLLIAAIKKKSIMSSVQYSRSIFGCNYSECRDL